MGELMVESKEWDWELADKAIWTKPCEESYFYMHQWQEEGRKSILDLGCGLGRHSILFAKNGFKVTAVDLSDYGIKYLKEWQKREDLDILTKVCDMNKLPFHDNAFDCIWSYHVISHTDTEGFTKILTEIERVLKPNGSIYFTLCSKATGSFTEANFEHIDDNTVIKTDGPEKEVPHYFVDLNDIERLLKNFEIKRIRHIDDCYFQGKNQNSKHYYIEAELRKPKTGLDFSAIIGNTVMGKIDRPLGSCHPRHPDIVYPINYGYTEGVFAGDGAEQDVYYLGEDKPIKDFEGKVIAVFHRHNDIEDKWIVVPEGMQFTDEEIMRQIKFQEKFFDGELYR